MAGQPARVIPLESYSAYEFQSLARYQAFPLPEEILSLQWSSKYEDVTIELATGRGKCELRRYEGEVPRQVWFSRQVPARELADVRRFLADRSVERLPSFDGANPYRGIEYADAIGYNFLRVRNGQARRVWFSLPPLEGTAYEEVARFFEKLGDPDRLRPHFDARGMPQGVQLVFAHPRMWASRVWAKGSDVRLLTTRLWDSSSEGWMRVEKGVLLPSGQPPAFPVEERAEDDPASFGLRTMRDGRVQKAFLRWMDGYVRGAISGQGVEGTWLCRRGQKPEFLFPGAIEDQIVTPNGRLVGTLDDQLILYDLGIRKNIPIDNPKVVNGCRVREYLPLAGSVLLVHYDVDSAGRVGDAAFSLLDPTSGRTTRMPHGFIAPDPHLRGLQPAKREGAVWIAKKGDAGSFVYEYDAKALRPLRWVYLAGIRFDSDTMWVDEEAGWLYYIEGIYAFRMPLSEVLLATQE